MAPVIDPATGASAAPYGDDLAHVHAAGFGDFARCVVPQVVSLLREAPPRPRVAVDLGCGAGVSTAALLAAGFHTIAVEPSRALLALARAAAPAARFIEASAYDYDLPPCGVILALGEPLTYHNPNIDADARLRTLFARAAHALVPGGLLVFDLIVAGEPALTHRGWAAGRDWAVLYETAEDAAARRLHRRIVTFREVDGRYRRGEETHHVRSFEQRAILAWLHAAGFHATAAASYGAVPLLPRRIAFTARRRPT